MISVPHIHPQDPSALNATRHVRLFLSRAGGRAAGVAESATPSPTLSEHSMHSPSRTFCSAQCSCPQPDSYTEILTPNVMASGGQGLREVSRS